MGTNKKRSKKRSSAKKRLFENLITGKNGAVLPIAANVTTILRLHPDWQGVLVHDVFAHTVRVTKAPPWDKLDSPAVVKIGEWSDADTARLGNWLSRMGLHVKAAVIEAAILVASDAARVHPVQEYLNGLKWDRKKRLYKFASEYLGAEQSEYTELIGTKWMIGAVARAMEPGCQVDNTLILESPHQGKRKSSALRALVPDPSWFGETPIEIGNKDSYQALRGKWIYALDELDSTRRAETTRVKGFLTQRIDTYRPSFGRRTYDFPRQTVFCGSTNEEHYLADRTGNRRYWPLRVKRTDTDAIERDRDQLWAEAVHLYKQKESWWDDNERFRQLCEAEQAEREQPDDWFPVIRKWVRSYDNGWGVLTLDVLTKSRLQFKAHEIHNGHTQRCAAVLRDLGYIRGARVRAGDKSNGARKQVRKYCLPTPKQRKRQRKRFEKLWGEKFGKSPKNDEKTH
jgi:putative DNA primase/helicase